VKTIIDIPIVAIGGINKDNCVSVVENGADGLVAISAIVCSDDVRRETEDFIATIRKIKQNSLNRVNVKGK
jgi:thiamine-phosphate pyrophosphorylase